MQMILGKASKIELIRQFGKLTPEQIIKRDYPSISKLSRSMPADQLEKIVGILLYDLSSSFNGVLDKEQVQEITVEITSSNLRNLSLEDLYWTCRTIKLSDQFGKLNTNKVLTVLHKHFDQRCELAYRHHLNQHLSTKFHDPSRNNALGQTKQKHHQAKLWYVNAQNQNNPNQKQSQFKDDPQTTRQQKKDR